MPVAQSALQIASDLEQLRCRAPRLIGRDRQLAALHAHIRTRRPLFVSGPAGVGKTALLHALYAGWDTTREGFPVFYCGESHTRHALATTLLVNLFLHGHSLRSTFLDRRKVVTSLSALRRFVTTERLPDLYRMLHQNLPPDACIVLDHIDNPDPKVASLIEVWIERMPLILVARRADRMGRARWLLSGCEHLEIPPLSAAALRRLASDTLQKVARCDVRDADIHRALVRAAGNPGRFKELLSAAVQHQKNGEGK